MVKKGKKSLFDYEYTVAWVDTDAMGIAHFSNYFRICEKAEQAYFESRKMDGNGIYLPRVHASCEYKSPLRFKDKATVSVRIDEIGKRHITFDYTITNKRSGEVSANCSIVVVPVYGDMRPAELTPELLEMLS